MKKKLIRTVLQIMALLAVVVLLGFVNNQRLETRCTEADVRISGDTTVHFLNSDDVLQLLESKGIRFKDVPTNEINLMEVEAVVKQHPAVESANAYAQQDGRIILDVIQRTPVLRVIDALGESYYIDHLGYFMPLMPRYTARVPVATGNIYDIHYRLNTNISALMANDSAAALAITDDLFLMIQAIRKDSFMLAQTEQLFVRPDRDVELMPRFGPQTVVIGDATQLEDKFSRLRLFYTKGLPQVGWNAYNTVNLKFKDQLICTKNIQ